MVCEKCLEGQMKLIEKREIEENIFYKRKGFLWSKLYRITDIKVIGTYQCTNCDYTYTKVLDLYREEYFVRDNFEEIFIPIIVVTFFVMLLLLCLIDSIGVKTDLLIIAGILISLLISIHLGLNTGLPKTIKESDKK